MQSDALFLIETDPQHTFDERRLSLLSPVLGETDAPAPVRAKEWARERGGVRVRTIVRAA
jgi:hypothetical protein